MMAKGTQTDMKLFQGRAPNVNVYDQIENMMWIPKVVNKTAAYQCLASESGTIFTNAGATASVTFTLPVAADGPFFFIFISAAATAIVVTDAANVLVAHNDLTATSVSWATANEIIGQAVMVIGNGTSNYAIALSSGTGTLTVV